MAVVFTSFSSFIFLNSSMYSEAAKSYTSGSCDFECCNVFINKAVSSVSIAVLMETTANDSVKTKVKSKYTTTSL